MHFGESAWSFPLVIGLAPAGMWDVTFSILLLFLNLGMAKLRSYKTTLKTPDVCVFLFSRLFELGEVRTVDPGLSPNRYARGLFHYHLERLLYGHSL